MVRLGLSSVSTSFLSTLNRGVRTKLAPQILTAFFFFPFLLRSFGASLLRCMHELVYDGGFLAACRVIFLSVSDLATYVRRMSGRDIDR